MKEENKTTEERLQVVDISMDQDDQSRHRMENQQASEQPGEGSSGGM